MYILIVLYKDTALLSSRDGYILELTVWPKMSQASCGVWREDSGLLLSCLRLLHCMQILYHLNHLGSGFSVGLLI